MRDTDTISREIAKFLLAYPGHAITFYYSRVNLKHRYEVMIAIRSNQYNTAHCGYGRNPQVAFNNAVKEFKACHPVLAR